MPRQQTTRKTENQSYQEAGAALAGLHGPMEPQALSDWFTRLFPGYSSGQDWEEFKLGYMSSLWNGAEELAQPVLVVDTNPDDRKSTDAVGFMTLAYITTGSPKLQLLDRYTELMADNSQA